MPFNAQVLRVLIASPSDCKAERELVPKLLQSWNSLHAFDLKTSLMPAKWEDDSYPSLVGGAQEVINQQIVRDADILVGFFWTRLGTATGKAASGSVEEINQFIEANKPVLLYFSDQPVVYGTVDSDQYAALKKFKAEMQNRGLVVTYNDASELREALPKHLLRAIRERFPTESTAQKPEGEIRAQGDANARFADIIHRLFLAWSVEKESPQCSDAAAKDILAGLLNELLAWRVTFDSVVGDDVIRDVDGAIRETKALTHFQMSMDGGVSWKAFWAAGTGLFTLLERVSKKMSSDDKTGLLSEEAFQLLNEIDSHPVVEERGITIVEGDLGPGLGHYFPFMWSSFGSQGGGSVTIMRLSPLKKLVAEMVSKRFLEEDSNDGSFAIYSRTGKPAPKS